MLLHGQYPVFIVLLYCWLSVFPPEQTQRRQTRLILNMASWLKKKKDEGGKIAKMEIHHRSLI